MLQSFWFGRAAQQSQFTVTELAHWSGSAMARGQAEAIAAPAVPLCCPPTIYGLLYSDEQK